MRCHYEVLGVEQTADQEELKKAYRKQVISFRVYLFKKSVDVNFQKVVQCITNVENYTIKY